MSTITHAIADYLAGLANADIPDKSYETHAPQGEQDDHLVVTKLTGDPTNDLQGRSAGARSAEFDIDCKSSDQPTADTMLQAVLTALEPYSGDLDADWHCLAVIVNDTTEAYLPPPGDGREVSMYWSSCNLTIQYQPV